MSKKLAFLAAVLFIVSGIAVFGTAHSQIHDQWIITGSHPPTGSFTYGRASFNQRKTLVMTLNIGKPGSHTTVSTYTYKFTLNGSSLNMTDSYGNTFAGNYNSISFAMEGSNGWILNFSR